MFTNDNLKTISALVIAGVLVLALLFGFDLT